MTWLTDARFDRNPLLRRYETTTIFWQSKGIMHVSRATQHLKNDF
jgi:hypothetical protein